MYIISHRIIFMLVFLSQFATIAALNLSGKLFFWNLLMCKDLQSDTQNKIFYII